MVQISTQQLLRRVAAGADFDLDSRLTDQLETTAADTFVGVGQGTDQPPYAGGDDRRGTRWRTALNRAGFQRAVQGGATSPIAGSKQGVGLGVRTADFVVVPFADDLAGVVAELS